MNREEIIELVRQNKIDANSPYLDDTNVMGIAVEINPDLLFLMDRPRSFFFVSHIFKNPNISLDKKKEVFREIVKRNWLNMYDASFNELFEDKEFLKEMASTDIMLFIALTQSKIEAENHDLLLSVYHSRYEENYSYNDDTPIRYGLNSPKCFMNTMRFNPYTTARFNSDVYMNDSVAEWIISNNKFGIPTSPMYSNPVITIAKLKKDPSFLYRLTNWAITKDVYDYLKTIEIDYDKLNSTSIHGNPYIMLLLIQSDRKYIGSINEDNVNNPELINYLVNSNYSYKEGDPKVLLNIKDIIYSTINNGGLDYIMSHDITLDNDLINYIKNYIVNNNYSIKMLANQSLIKNKDFMAFLNSHYSVSNDFNLEDRYKYHYLLKDIDREFMDYFGVEATNKILNQIVMNNYDINMINIFKNTNKRLFSKLYKEIANTINPMDKDFDYSLFIKVVEYFNNNSNLLRELSNSKDYDINKLIIAIYNNLEVNNLNELNNIDNVRKNIIDSSNLSIKDKICMSLVSSNYENVKKFLNKIINVDNLLYLELNFNKNSYEYNLMETILPILELLESIDKLDNDQLNNLYESLKTNKPSFIKNLDIISNNIKTIYAKLYLKKKPNIEELRKRGKVKTIDGVDIIDITGEDFYLFSHNLHFNQEDTYKSITPGELFREFSRDDSRYTNYVCTTYESRYSQTGLSNPKGSVVFYELDDIHDLIGFGNDDIYTAHTKKPLITMNPSYVNPIDMSFIQGGGFTNTEFTFYRNKSDSRIKTPKYMMTRDDREPDIKYAKGVGINYIKFDREKHKESIRMEYDILKQNIDKINTLDIYKLIGLSKSLLIREDISELIKNMDLSRFSGKEIRVINSALRRYKYNLVLEKQTERIEGKSM